MRYPLSKKSVKIYIKKAYNWGTEKKLALTRKSCLTPH